MSFRESKALESNMERNILLTIEYDGTGFSGWQRQPGVRTVQGELEKALSYVCGKPVQINGTSRTDAGVHALSQRASFRGEFGIPTDRIPLAVNNYLAGSLGSGYACGDVRIIRAEEMPADFHARFDSKGKTYRYILRHGSAASAFSRNYCYHLKAALAAEPMRKAAAFIEGTHDFACFQAAGGTVRETTVRTIYDLQIKEPVAGEMHIEVRWLSLQYGADYCGYFSRSWTREEVCRGHSGNSAVGRQTESGAHSTTPGLVPGGNILR